ncbi:hypothetical protein GCM10022252_76230 [Streptosporangium oxazolinicum]|uniref:Uncharacterized protein n=1 Tax=Streptosporangium oxazolinicum TaxID=909287 RepID=A0ABP8BL62_9ACTN
MPIDKAPYDARGNLQHYPGPSYSAQLGSVPTDWRPNTPFTATLTFRGSQRGRSAAYFLWEDANGRTYPMFLADLGDLILSTTLDKGVITGEWIVGKRGKNYGLKHHKPAPPSKPRQRKTRSAGGPAEPAPTGSEEP